MDQVAAITSLMCIGAAVLFFGLLYKALGAAKIRSTIYVGDLVRCDRTGGLYKVKQIDKVVIGEVYSRLTTAKLLHLSDIGSHRTYELYDWEVTKVK